MDTTPTGVIEQDSPPSSASEGVTTQSAAQVTETLTPQKPPKGFVPYQALEEERTKRKEAEEKLAAVSVPTADTDDLYSDEGRELKGEIKSLSEKLRAIELKEARREAEALYPALKDKQEEFDAFLEDEENKRLSISKAAKLFLAEKNLLAPEPPVRAGLEKPTGGTVTPEPKLSPDEVASLMKTDWRKYEKLVRQGKI